MSSALASKLVPPRLPIMEGPRRRFASDIDTAMVDSLKALNPKLPIREADIRRTGWMSEKCRYCCKSEQPRKAPSGEEQLSPSQPSNTSPPTCSSSRGRRSVPRRSIRPDLICGRHSSICGWRRSVRPGQPSQRRRECIKKCIIEVAARTDGDCLGLTLTRTSNA